MSQVRVKDGKRTVSFYTALSSEEVELAVQQYAGMKTFKKRPRSTPADESDFVPSAPRGQDGVEEMLVEFTREFAVEQVDDPVPNPRAGIKPNLSMDGAKPAGEEKKLEPVSLCAENVEIKMSDRERTCRVCSSQNL